MDSRLRGNDVVCSTIGNNMPRTTHRRERVADLIQQTIAKLLQHGARDPRFAAVTITDVDVSPDLKNAMIFVSMLDDTKVVDTVKALNHAAGYLQHELGEAVELRVVPKLQFRYDDTLSRADRLTKLIDDAIKKKSEE
jgi:ribosome-binding factor A